MRMSSGASYEYEKPRSQVSTCIEDTPRSRYAMSACTPSWCSCSSASAKSMRMKRVSHSTSRAKASNRSSAAGSRSMHTSIPPGPIRPATNRAWPPSPNVQSIAVSPGCGSRRSISSPARTGTCVRVMSRRMVKALGDPLDLAHDPALRLGPAAAVPDHHVVLMADHDDLPVDPRVVEKRLVERHSPPGVELGGEGPAREEADDLAPPGGYRGELPHHPPRQAGEAGRRARQLAVPAKPLVERVC